MISLSLSLSLSLCRSSLSLSVCLCRALSLSLLLFMSLTRLICISTPSQKCNRCCSRFAIEKVGKSLGRPVFAGLAIGIAD